MEVMHGPNRDLLLPPQGAQPVGTIDQQWAFNMVLFLEETDGSLGNSWLHLGPFYPKKKTQLFILTGLHTYSRYQFAFSSHRPSAGFTIQGLKKYLIHKDTISHDIASAQDALFPGHMRWRWGQPWFHGILWLYYILYHSQCNWDCLLKLQLKWQLRGKILWG